LNTKGVSLRDEMTRFIARGLSAGLTCCALLATPDAHAEALGPTLLQYQASAACPSAADFQRAVQRRSARLQFVAEGSHERTLAIALRAGDTAVVGELRLLEADGSVRQRNVRFSNCAEAVEGLALIAAVSLDPQSLLEAAPQEPAPPPRPPPVAQTAKPDAPRHHQPPLVAPRPKRLPALRTRAGAEFEAYLHVTPEAALGGKAYFDLTFRPDAQLAPLLRAALSHAERRGIREGSGATSFALTLGTISLCPWRFGSARLELRPCAWATFGALRSWSSKTMNPRTDTREYWAGGVSALAFVKLGETTEITLDSELGAPLRRDRFVFEGSQFWKTPPLYVCTGLGLRFLLR
jgi:hypothetical protein